jgi:hypothetical protein
MKFFLILLFVIFSFGIKADPLMLVTEDEVKISNLHKPEFQVKSIPVPDAPKIELLKPKLDSTIFSTTPIELKFIPTNPASIKPESFKAYYGSFQIDITSRITSSSKVTPAGIQVSEANLPRGNHKLTLNIEDSEGRMGSKTIEFAIK